MSAFCLQRVSPIGVAPIFFLRNSLSMLTRRPPKKRDPSLCITPSPNGADNIQSPNDFLKAIGRKSETKMTIESWTQFWKMDGQAMRKAGVAVKDRRYILWCKEKYRLGFSINEFSHEPRPKKVIRGWGPKVQNGKRIRSRRVKTS